METQTRLCCETCGRRWRSEALRPGRRCPFCGSDDTTIVGVTDA